MGVRRLVVGSIVASAVFFGVPRVKECAACSCLGPRDLLVGPDRADDTPLNAKVRLEVARGSSRASGAVLRVHDGAKIDTTMRTWVDGSLDFVELTPAKPLPPDTRFEIAVVDPAKYPSTSVLGTFKTGTATDTTAPKLDAIGTAVAHANAHPGGGDCSIAGPWIEIGPVRAADPGRPNAKLMFAVWLGDAAGNVDTKRPPTDLVAVNRDLVTIGKRSLCDPHDFPIPKAPSVSLAIAAIDESGNASAPRRVRVDLRHVGARP